jgi:hypothetical protein
MYLFSIFTGQLLHYNRTGCNKIWQLPINRINQNIDINAVIDSNIFPEEEFCCGDNTLTADSKL